MNVRIGAVCAIAKAIVNEVQTSVDIITVAKHNNPLVSRSCSSSIISIGGTSISSITPEHFLGGLKAAA